MATTVGEWCSWLALGGLTVGAMVSQAACGPSSPAGDPVLDAATTDLLESVGPYVVRPALAAFESDLDRLDDAINAWRDALASGTAGEPERIEAQDAWVEAMLTWQKLEMMQIGPAGSSLSAVAGADIRDEVYSWPTTNPCRVDQGVVSREYEAPSFFEDNLVNAYGLDALEHLLFSGAENACPAQVDINSSGAWSDLGDDGVPASRAAYASVLVSGIAQRADELQTVWDPAGGDFSAKLSMSDPSTPYASEQEALNAVFDAMFYLETRIKDQKLATPIGLGDCSEAQCPDAVELWASGTSTEAVIANLEGFRQLFTGGEGGGMDDRLDAAGHADLAVEIIENTDAAIELARELDPPLQELVVSNPDQAEALHAAVKSVADILKGDLATVMMLEIPSEAAGDND